MDWKSLLFIINTFREVAIVENEEGYLNHFLFYPRHHFLSLSRKIAINDVGTNLIRWIV
jgi:hypothetical protein